MRKVKFSIITMIALLGIMGIAWAAFVFSNVASDDAGLSIGIEGYSDAGTVTISNITNNGGFVLDNDTDMIKTLTFDVKHDPDTDPNNEIVGTPNYAVVLTINATEIGGVKLADYITVTSDALTSWTDTTLSTVTVTIAWIPGQIPENKTDWTTLKNLVEAITADAINILATATYA